MRYCTRLFWAHGVIIHGARWPKAILAVEPARVTHKALSIDPIAGFGKGARIFFPGLVANERGLALSFFSLIARFTLRGRRLFAKRGMVAYVNCLAASAGSA